MSDILGQQPDESVAQWLCRLQLYANTINNDRMEALYRSGGYPMDYYEASQPAQRNQQSRTEKAERRVKELEEERLSIVKALCMGGSPPLRNECFPIQDILGAIEALKKMARDLEHLRRQAPQEPPQDPIEGDLKWLDAREREQCALIERLSQLQKPDAYSLQVEYYEHLLQAETKLKDIRQRITALVHKKMRP